MALGVLTQLRGPHQQPIAYLSRELDVISRAWPHCLRVIGAAAVLAPKALIPIPKKAIPKNAQTTTQLHSSHTLVR